MAFNMRLVRLQAPATNTTQDYTVSGFGTPQAAIIWSTIASGDDADTNDMQLSIGLWDGTNERCVFNASVDNVDYTAAVSTRCGSSTSQVVHMEDLALDGTDDRTATVTATPTDGITLTWSGDDTTIQPYVTVMLINGCTAVGVGDVTPNATVDSNATATENLTGVNPNVVFGIMTRHNFGDVDTLRKQISFGFAYDTGAAIEQYCLMTMQGDTAGAPTNGEISNTRIGMVYGSTAAFFELELASMGTEQFTVTSRLNGSAAYDLGYLALEVADGVATFDSTTPTAASGDWTPMSGEAFTPGSTIMLSSFQTAFDTDSSTNLAGFWGLYAADETNEYSISTVEEDAPVSNIKNISSRISQSLFTQDDTGGTPDFTATNPQFGSGTITYADANVSQASQASIIAGIAFEAPDGVPLPGDTIIIPTGPAIP